MKKFQVRFVREVTQTDVFYREVEAETAEAAQAIADDIAEEANGDCPDDVVQESGDDCGDWSGEVQED